MPEKVYLTVLTPGQHVRGQRVYTGTRDGQAIGLTAEEVEHWFGFNAVASTDYPPVRAKLGNEAPDAVEGAVESEPEEPSSAPDFAPLALREEFFESPLRTLKEFAEAKGLDYETLQRLSAEDAEGGWVSQKRKRRSGE